MSRTLVLAGCALLAAVAAVGLATHGHGKAKASAASTPARHPSSLGLTVGRSASRASKQAADDSLTWHVVSSYTTRKIQNAYLPAAATGTYVILNVAATNRGSQAVTLDDSHVRLDLGGASYAPDASGLSALELAGHKGLPGAAVGPGATVTGWVVFDVPTHATTSTANICLDQRAASSSAASSC